MCVGTTPAKWGFTHAIAKLAPELTGKPGPYDSDALKSEVNRYAAFGFKIAALEGDQFDMTTIKLGLHGRDEAPVRYERMLQNMGRLGINILCYNFMPLGWLRNRQRVGDRGGAIVMGYRHLSGRPVRLSRSKASLLLKLTTC